MKAVSWIIGGLPFLLLALFLLVPLYYFSQFMTLTKGLSDSDLLKDLLKVSLGTSAFMIALYTLFSKDQRLRGNSENVFVALIFFLLANLFLCAAYICVLILSIPWAKSAGHYLSYVGCAILICNYTFLSYVFLNTYNQIYNLRINKAWKFFKPIRELRRLLGSHKFYEAEVDKRESSSLSLFKKYFGDEEVSRLSKGGSILLLCNSPDSSSQFVDELIAERLLQKETINYVCAHRHPISVWERIQQKHSLGTDQLRDLIFIDAYSPSYAFTDDTHEENDRKLGTQGIRTVKAKTFSGLHTAMAKAFNIIKQNEKAKGRAARRPMTVIYAYTSALCEFESFEQFKVFWWHVIPSESSYGIITIIIESEYIDKAILDSLKQRVDFCIRVSVSPTENGKATFSREL